MEDVLPDNPLVRFLRKDQSNDKFSEGHTSWETNVQSSHLAELISGEITCYSLHSAFARDYSLCSGCRTSHSLGILSAVFKAVFIGATKDSR